MICSASCGNRVATRCDRASAVCFIGPQRPSATIEIRQVDAERHRRRGPALGLGHLEVLDLQARPATSRAPPPARRRTALPTVRTTSSGCSSPNSPAPRRPGQLAGRTGVAQVVLARAAGRQVGEDLAPARCRRAGAAPSGAGSARRRRGSPSPAGAAPAPAPAAGARRRRRTGRAAARPPPRRRRPGSRPGAPGRAARAGRRARRSRPGRAVASPYPSGPRRRASARRGPSRAPGAAPAGCRSARPAARRSGAVAERLVHQPRQLLALLRAAATASAARPPRPAGPARRSARRRSPGCSGKNSPCSAMNSANASVGVLAPGVLAEQVVEVARPSRRRLASAAGSRPAARRASRRTAARPPRGAARRGSAGTSPAPRRWPSRSRPAPRTARAVDRGRLSSIASSNRAASSSRPRSSSRSAARAWSSSCWARVTAPSRLPRRSASRRIRRARACRSSRPRPSRGPRRSRSRSASRRLPPPSTSLADLVDGRPHVVRRGERVGPVPPRPVPEAVVRVMPISSPYTVRPSSVSSLDSRRVRCRPSSTNSMPAPPARGSARRRGRAGRAPWPGPARCRPGASSSSAGDQVAGLDDVALGDQVGEAGQVQPGQPGPERLGGGRPQQVGEDLDLPALLTALELDLAAQRAGHRHGVADPGHRVASRRAGRTGAARTRRRSRRPRSRTGPRRPERASTAGDSRTARVKRASTSITCSGHRRATSAASCRISVDLQLEVERVVGADLGAEPVLERGDDPAAVGVVLRVGAGHQQQVQRQPQLVAADLDVALLEHVEQRHLDALGQVGQLVDGEDAAVGPRHQAEVDGLRVAQGAALGHPDRVDVADQVADAGVRGGQLLAVPLERCSQATGRSSPHLGGQPAGGRGERRVRVLVQLGAGDHRGPLVEQVDQRRGSAGSCPGRARRAAPCRGRRASPARPRAARCRRSRRCPGNAASPGAQPVEQVVAELLLDGAELRGRRRGARRGCGAGSLSPDRRYLAIVSLRFARSEQRLDTVRRM